MKQVKILKCNHCGNIALMLHDTNVPMSCCGEEMLVLKANSSDGANEKHVPIIKSELKECKASSTKICEVQVGSVVHPMLSEHYINWVGSFGNDTWVIKWLTPSGEPKCNLPISKDSSLYEYCNLHGLWKNK